MLFKIIQCHVPWPAMGPLRVVGLTSHIDSDITTRRGPYHALLVGLDNRLPSITGFTGFTFHFSFRIGRGAALGNRHDALRLSPAADGYAHLTASE